ncbi:matrixin family metalloprotease [Ekhidna sp.]|uniref:matrixin family metalloprotease n=1 Tax=Ekhidna sp. TaxID=2608089 RepID=UPI003CCBF637
MKTFLITFTLAILCHACAQEKKDKASDLVYLNSSANLDKQNEFYQDSLIEFDDSNKVYFDQSIGFDRFINRYDTVIIDQEIFFIVQGDLLLDMDEMVDYYSTYFNDTTQYEKLVIDVLPDGKINKMPNADQLTYAVVRSSFPSENEYKSVVRYMAEATRNWSDILPEKVAFKHLSYLDDQLRPSQQHPDVTFTIRHYNSGGKFVAAAFFPHYSKYRWKVRIDPSYYTTRADKVGVLRHEIGHILGFRHEHIRAEAPIDCPREDDTTFDPLTSYDKVSVMHYPCGGFGDLNLAFTEKDIKGSRLIYN